jgi:myosin-7
LKNFIPKALINSKKPQEWEALILKQHATCRGKSVEDAKTEYLDIVKQWPYYGTTFYPPCKAINCKNLPNKVIIGVNFEGIRLLKSRNKVFQSFLFLKLVLINI